MPLLRAPRFWTDASGGASAGPIPSLMPALLAPLGALTARLTARRLARGGWIAPVPVVCVGNLTLGGTGKTIVVLALARRLIARGVSVHILTRGYGGRARGPLRVAPDHRAALVGDEALLLARVAPVWVGRDRAASARAAIAAGASLLLMDDGLQNPTLEKSLSLLVIDGGVGFGNGRVFPAGPLREPIAAGVRRAHGAVVIGDDERAAGRAVSATLPVLSARLSLGPEGERLARARVVAFAGIGRPEKFFTSLREAGAFLLACHAFADHHRYRAAELARLWREAERKQAVLVTTEKDRVRLPDCFRERVLAPAVSLVWNEPERIEALLASLVVDR